MASRISEALTLHVSDVDFENLLVKLDGKGRKQRVVPLSMTPNLGHLFDKFLVAFGKE